VGKGNHHKMFNGLQIVVYYESRKRELKIRLMIEGRFDERLKKHICLLLIDKARAKDKTYI
jgi:hypothetical protein